MYKFFVEDKEIENDEIILTGENKNHIINVLRMKPGEQILVSSKTRLETFECEISRIDKEEVICTVKNKLELTTEPKIKVDLFQGLPKSDKMEYIIQKSIELGIHSVTPVNMKYCIAKIKDEEKKNARWNKISEAAAKQSKRDIIPVINSSVNLKELYNKIKQYDLTLLAYENEENVTIKDILKINKNNLNTIALIIGPEGRTE